MDGATGGTFSPSSLFPIDRATGVAIIMWNKKVYLHCKMGGRAKQEAGYLLTQMGYQGVVVVWKETCFGQLVAAEICDVVICDGRNQGFERLNY